MAAASFRAKRAHPHHHGALRRLWRTIFSEGAA
jgi:hypothetical protein